jgi:tRNA threonylcarbamoyladenosine biosynthesis protein TsaB
VRVLGIDTSSATGSVALVEVRSAFDVDVIASATARVSNAHGESLLPLIEGVMRAGHAELASIDLLAVGVGPGSFTGTRIGVATAKGIAIASNKPLRGIDAFAALAIDAGVEGPIVCAIDARKGEVYVSVVRIDGDDVVTLVDGAHVKPDRVAAHEGFAVGDGVSLVPGLVARRHVGALVPRAEAVAALAGSRQSRAFLDEVDTLEPLYVRPPDITAPTRTPFALPNRPSSK